MKKTLLFIFCVGLSFLYAQPRVETAKDFDLFVGDALNVCVKQILLFAKADVWGSDTKTVATEGKNLAKTLSTTVSKIEKLEDTKNTAQYKKEALAALAQMQDAWDTEFGALEGMKKDAEESAPAMFKYCQKHQSAYKKLFSAYKRYDKAREAFAQAQKFAFTKSADMKVWEIAGAKLPEALKYADQIYMTHFKFARTLAGFQTAAEEMNTPIMTRKKGEILSLAQNEYAKLDTLKAPFAGDKMRDVTYEFIKFYRDNGSKDMQSLILWVKENPKPSKTQLAEMQKTLGTLMETNAHYLGRYTTERINYLKKYIPLSIVAE